MKILQDIDIESVAVCPECSHSLLLSKAITRSKGFATIIKVLDKDHKPKVSKAEGMQVELIEFECTCENCGHKFTV